VGDDKDCDDGDLCTLDACSLEGDCTHDPDPSCVPEDAGTTDSSTGEDTGVGSDSASDGATSDSVDAASDVAPDSVSDQESSDP
jgi:hypothetical protein